MGRNTSDETGGTEETFPLGALIHPNAQGLETLRSKLPELPIPPSSETTKQLFRGFREFKIRTSGAEIFVIKSGEGPPLLLLHGYPQTHVAWHKIATSLAVSYTVVIPDLRGYGDSSKPEGGEYHVNYSFRAMAQDMVELMKQFGFDRFYLAGHDRGGRVAHRLGLDHPGSVIRMCVMDIAPTLTMYRDTNQEFATLYIWWFFLIQHHPIPEHLIGLDPEYFLKMLMGRSLTAITPAAAAEYLRCYCCTSTIHATCEDYRAAAAIDLNMDAADELSGRKLTMPLFVLWGMNGVVGKMWDVIDTWRSKATCVSGRALECGHFLPEEEPQQVLFELLNFFRE